METDERKPAWTDVWKALTASVERKHVEAAQRKGEYCTMNVVIAEIDKALASLKEPQ